ncbi:MAG: HpcH/HpaI aldolase/citrate lyase family protein [Rhodobiaceae bacterium]|nr:HpcH/HpaI aldolase/citrate lyase family protein [Rhodobiaceae bacterium]
MDLPKNPFKAAIAAGKPQIGLWCTIPDQTVVELVANCGFDWLMFDTEHSPMDAVGVLPLLQAVAPYPVSPVVRPTGLDPAEIKKLLDLGAQSILVPYIRDAAEADLAVRAVTYPPAGMRGVSGVTRATRYGAVANYHKRAREEICLIVQIETLSALEDLDNILAVDGIDGVFVGPADLAASLGYPGEPGHPEVRKVCLDTIRRIRAAGLPAGFLSPDEGYVEAVIEAGSVFTAVAIDTVLLRKGALASAARWKAD